MLLVLLVTTHRHVCPTVGGNGGRRDSVSGPCGMYVDEHRRDAFERRISPVPRPIRAGLPAVLTGPSGPRARRRREDCAKPKAFAHGQYFVVRSCGARPTVSIIPAHIGVTELHDCAALVTRTEVSSAPPCTALAALPLGTTWRRRTSTSGTTPGTRTGSVRRRGARQWYHHG